VVQDSREVEVRVQELNESNRERRRRRLIRRKKSVCGGGGNVRRNLVGVKESEKFLKRGTKRNWRWIVCNPTCGGV